MTKIAASYGPAWAKRDGETLTGEMSYQASGKKSAKRWPSPCSNCRSSCRAKRS